MQHFSSLQLTRSKILLMLRTKKKKDPVSLLFVKALVRTSKVQQVSLYTEFALDWTLLQTVWTVQVMKMYSAFWITAPQFWRLFNLQFFLFNLLKIAVQTNSFRIIWKRWLKGMQVHVSQRYLLLSDAVIQPMVTPDQRLGVIYSLLFMLLYHTKSYICITAWSHCSIHIRTGCLIYVMMHICVPIKGPQFMLVHMTAFSHEVERCFHTLRKEVAEHRLPKTTQTKTSTLPTCGRLPKKREQAASHKHSNSSATHHYLHFSHKKWRHSVNSS